MATIITPAVITALFTSWNADFQKGLTGAKPQYQKICMVVKSTTASNTYGWLGKFPNLREWVGDRVIKSMKAHGYTISNKTFESTVGVGRDDIEDDNVGVYSPVFEEMGRAVEIQPDELAFGLLKAGTSTLCYDGQNYFDTDHPVYPNVDGTGTAESVSNYDDNGGSGTTWYLLDTSRAVKPVIFQDRRKPNLQSMTKLDDEKVFTSNEFRFGADCRRNVGFSFWQLAYASRKELNSDNLWAAITAMREYEADGGQKLGVKPTLIVVPPGLEKQATRMLERELDSNSSNELKGRLELVVADYL
ncbi:head protein [Marinomonas sp. S3726]|uniref:Mu-like prophage major head subunit gpT family protein n=1 Tax=Marinomonas sp. S3726 TaxID=579484 RepID=UPI0005FA71D8|nr:Mu-like prophage major head subunit gpT family protein [Marinomonas sp. S3726]KJZ06444.1 head protein [Marinomonas sp. S3726]